MTRAATIQQTTPAPKRSQNADCDAETRQAETLAEDHPEDISTLRTERHTYANLPGALAH